MINLLLMLLCLNLLYPNVSMGYESITNRYDLLSTNYKLVVIHSVGKDKKHFVIRRGMQEGINLDSEFVFSTDKISIAAKAIEVDSEFSLWRIKETRAIVPFNKKEFVTMNRSEETIWVEMPQFKRRRVLSNFTPRDFWLMRFNISRGLSESISQTTPTSNKSRTGFQVEAVWNSQFYSDYFRRFHMGIGLRFDHDALEERDIGLIIPTDRYLLNFEMVYHFSPLSTKIPHFYAGAGSAIGYSYTQIENNIAAGPCYIFPTLRVGYFLPMAERKALTAEMVFETIYSDEKFKTGIKQSTEISAAKVSLGLTF